MTIEIHISADVVAFLSILLGIYIAASRGLSRLFTVIDDFTWRVHYMTEQEVFTSYNPKTILQNVVSNFSKTEFQLEIVYFEKLRLTWSIFCQREFEILLKIQKELQTELSEIGNDCLFIAIKYGVLSYIGLKIALYLFDYLLRNANWWLWAGSLLYWQFYIWLFSLKIVNWILLVAPIKFLE